jgi:hypothetical protein
MIVTKQQLQQMIDEEFARALKVRSQKKLVRENGGESPEDEAAEGMSHHELKAKLHGILHALIEQLGEYNARNALDDVWVEALRSVATEPAEEEEDDGSWRYAARVNR